MNSNVYYLYKHNPPALFQFRNMTAENPHLSSFLTSRRNFLKKAGLLAATGLLIPKKPFALNSKALHTTRKHTAEKGVRIRGNVHVRGKALAGVSVTDGIRVTRTDKEGAFDLYSDGRRDFVYLSLPSGYRIPVNPTGTARFYQRIDPDTNGRMTTSFELEPLSEVHDPEHYHFLLMADPQTENEYEVARFHNETIPDIRNLKLSTTEGKPVFGIGCGDLMFDNLELFPEYEKAVKKTGIPFFQVIGNHDILFDVRTSQESHKVFHTYFGPSHYSFEAGEVHFVVLNNIFWHGAGYVGYLDRDQLDWLRADLRHVEPGRTVVVAMHIPAFSSQHLRTGQNNPSPRLSTTNRRALYELLEPYNAHILSAHMHEHEHVFEGSVHEHIHGTACGAWWSGQICFDGTPNGYSIYEVRGSELRWQYKATGHDPNHQMRLYETGSDPDLAGHILANIWDWDPEWQIFWYEDGMKRGRMKQRTGLDPLAVERMDGPNKPPRRTWVNPVSTNHLFHAPVSPGTRHITAEAYDRWGRRYKQSLLRS